MATTIPLSSPLSPPPQPTVPTSPPPIRRASSLPPTSPPSSPTFASLLRRKQESERRSRSGALVLARARVDAARAALRAAEALAGRSAAKLRAALRDLDEAVAKLKEARRRIKEMIMGSGEEYEYTHDKCKMEGAPADGGDKCLHDQGIEKSHGDAPAQKVKDVTKMTPLRPVAGAA